MKKKKKDVFILEPICSHVGNTRVPGKGNKDYKRPLNGHKMSGESILKLFSQAFEKLILIHLKVHSPTPLAFALLGERELLDEVLGRWCVDILFK